MRLRIAWRNTFRNRRRTVLNVAMIAGGVSAVILFEGFAHNLIIGLREVTIQTQSGHLQIANSSFWEQSAKDPRQNLLPHYQSLISQIKSNPHVTYASGRLSFFGLLSHGEQSISAKGISFDPAGEAARGQSFHYISGHGLTQKNPFEIALGSGLAKRMHLKVDDHITVLGYTYDGAVNALDMGVCGVFQTDIAEFDDNVFLLPLTAAQNLLDIQDVEQIIVGLDNTDNTAPVMAQLGSRLPSQAKIEIKPWYALATFFRQVAAFTAVQNHIMELIILTLVLLSIMNTIGMSVSERAGEIGTVRALGEPEKMVLVQFLLEGMILGILGWSLGAVGSGTIALVVNACKIPVIMPGASSVIPLQVDLIVSAFVDAFVLALIAAIAAAYIPALRASKLRVIDALRRNI